MHEVDERCLDMGYEEYSDSPSCACDSLEVVMMGVSPRWLRLQSVCHVKTLSLAMNTVIGPHHCNRSREGWDVEVTL